MKITAKQLLAMGCCDDGVNRVKKLLPATISPDPEDNLPLAIKLGHLGSGCCSSCNDSALSAGSVRYAFNASMNKDFSVLRDAELASTKYGRGVDIGLVAQGLAILADTMSARKRK